MNPAIAGTLIGGGFALVGGLVGVAGSMWGTSRSSRANRELAREERLWEKRSAVYEQLLAAIPISFAKVDALEPVFNSLLGLGPSMRAYASDAVVNQWRATVETLVPYDPRTIEPLTDSDRFDSFRRAASMLAQAVRDDLQGAQRRARPRG